ncbi:disease resistance protein RGA5-like [Miscanthus floridulus]|uniref:disease resistance protein RGA5-like n=1 Tax=Miscanthus floridulus TaxID=154761 RepID=UPI003457DDA5
MAAAVVASISMGVMKPVLSKLTTLMGDEYNKINGLRKEVSFLRRELSDMVALLDKMDNADELDPHVKRVDLTCVSQLSQLRYLKVASEAWYLSGQECLVVLPNQVRRMHRLETLEIDLDVLSIPTDIVHLPCLSHFIVRGLKTLPDGIGKVKSLRTLRRFRLPADSSDETIEGLGELTNLEELELSCLVEGPACAYALRSWVLPPFPFLDVFDVAGWTFSRVPRWIGGLHNLQKLRFGVKEVSHFMWDDIAIMGMLPNLIILSLRVEGDIPTEGIVIGGPSFSHILIWR